MTGSIIAPFISAVCRVSHAQGTWVGSWAKEWQRRMKSEGGGKMRGSGLWREEWGSVADRRWAAALLNWLVSDPCVLYELIENDLLDPKVNSRRQGESGILGAHRMVTRLPYATLTTYCTIEGYSCHQLALDTLEPVCEWSNSFEKRERKKLRGCYLVLECIFFPKNDLKEKSMKKLQPPISCSFCVWKQLVNLKFCCQQSSKTGMTNTKMSTSLGPRGSFFRFPRGVAKGCGRIMWCLLSDEKMSTD